MSDNTNLIGPALKPITAPTLNDAGYASALNDTFKNIDDNFATIANYDFIKGESGSSVIIRNTPLFVKDEFGNYKVSYYGQMLKDYIVSLAENNIDEQAPVTLDDGTVLDIFDNFTVTKDENDNDVVPSLYMIYGTENNLATTTTPTTSLYYVFLDGRYASKRTGLTNPEQYVNIKDFSCILVYDGSLNDNYGGFKSLNNSFPTIYYEKNVGLCWKINGSETGLPVQGIPGKDGSNATLYIVRSAETIVDSNNPGVSTQCVVSGIYESYDGYVSVEDYKIDNDISSLNNQSALILGPDPNSSSMLFYFGKLSYDSDTGLLYAFCNPSTSINVAIDNEAFINAMRSIKLTDNGEDGSSGLRGLFIPLEDKKDDNTQKVHILSATSISNLDGISNDLRTDVIFTPVSDINNFTINESGANIQVDKYMYLKVNTTSMHKQMRDRNGIDLDASNGYLKYKLSSIIIKRNSKYLGKYDASDTESAGSRHYGKISNPIEGGTPAVISLTEGITLYVNPNNAYSTVKDHLDSMPASFYERLKDDNEQTDVPGIYMWELEGAKDDWDIDELKALNIKEYSFPAQFNHIFTTTVTPGAGAEIMWFNGFELYDNRYVKASDGSNAIQYVVPGWSDSNEFFDFVKFVPIYLNSHGISEDSALNLNYNVNITGDESSPTKNITVHGDVNCDNLSVYKLTATGTIKDIYSEDDIVSSKGLKLGATRSQLEDGENPTCSINVEGNIDANEANFKRVYTPELVATTLHNSVLNTNDINIDISDNTYLHINSSTRVDDAIDADLQGINNITITASNNKSSNIASVSKITTSVPSHNVNGSVITVSNLPSDSYNVYLTNAPAKSGSHDPGSGVYSSSNNDAALINDTSFDSAKNYNMHRLSLNASSTSGSSVSKKSTNNLASTEAKLVLDYTGSWTNDTGAQSSPTNTITLLKDSTIQQMSFARSAANCIINTNNEITVSFLNDFLCHVGLYGQCSKGGWPSLNSASQMTLELYYSTDGGVNLSTTNSKLTYKFDYSTDSVADDNGKEWVGYTSSGDYLSGNYDAQWRYYAFKFKPTQMKITTSSSAFTNIASAFNTGKTITLYVVAKFSMRAHTCKNMYGNRKELVKGIQVYLPRSYGYNSGSASTQLVRQTSNPGIKTNFNANSINGYAQYTENTSGSSNSGVAATTICDDGIVIRAGGYVFGLGYTENFVNHNKQGYEIVDKKISSTHGDAINPTWAPSSNDCGEKQPILFYHEYRKGYYDGYEPKGDSDDVKTNYGYAKRMNVIPLKDLFATIQALRNNTDYGI